MPYITQARKDALPVDTLPQPECAGELNYLFTVIAHNYLKLKGKNYQHINDVVGALDGAKVEFQRRVVAPYEDTKIQQNGDVP